MRSAPALGGLLAAALLLVSGSVRGERIPFSVPLEQRGYQLIKQQDGVNVYKHQGASDIRLAAETRLEAPPEDVMAALLDYPGQVGHIKRLSESKVLSYRPGWLRVYQRLNLPVIDDRDFTLEVTWGRNREARWIEYHAVPAGPPPRSGVVRVRHHGGSWLLRPINGGRATLLRFTVSMDMAGWVPRWMVRPGSAKELPELFKSLRSLLARSKERRVAWYPR